MSHHDWPSGATHLLTHVPPEWPEDEEDVAVAVFGRLSKTANWGEQAVARSKDAPEPPVHAFIANQDMQQEWSSEGIDGVRLASAEFSDIHELTLSPAKDLAKAGPLADAGYWLICRYD